MSNSVRSEGFLKLAQEKQEYLSSNAPGFVSAERVVGTDFRTCGFRGCTSFASHVLCVDGEAQVFCCAQCAAVGVRGHLQSQKTRGSKA